MKTFRLIGMALLAVVMCANFTSCSSDDDPDFNYAEIVGTWYLASEKWYSYNADGTPNMKDVTHIKEYPYHSDERIWTITKKGDGVYKLEDYEASNGYSDVEEFQLIKKNTFKIYNDLFTIKSLTDKEMVLEYIDHYFDFFDEKGNLINNDPNKIVDELEFGYYSFTR